MKMLTKFLAAIMIMASSTLIHAEEKAPAKEFPGRAIYLGTAYIELIDFYKQFDLSIPVDVRSKYEYDTLKIIGARNIPLNSRSFISDMRKLREANPDKPIVVYCNGKTCMKSYKAASKARKYGIENVVAYDTGMMDWAKTYPEKSELLGKSPIDPSKLISKARFKEHLLKADDFAAHVKDGNAVVLDVRDRYQRMGMGLFVGIEAQVNLDDDSIVKYIKKSLAENKRLYIYDEAGKQVRWLMYRLEEYGAKDYMFMEGGTRKYFKSLKSNLNFKS